MRSFEGLASFDEDTLRSTDPGGHHDRSWCCKTESARTGNNKDRDCELQRKLKRIHRLWDP